MKGRARYANGRLVKPTVAEREKRAAEVAPMARVLAQPHRRGNTDRLVESPLGCIVRKHQAPVHLWVVGCNFGELVRVWSAAIGAPSPILASNYINCGSKVAHRPSVAWVSNNKGKIIGVKGQSDTYVALDHGPLIDKAAATARRAEQLARSGHCKLKRLRDPVDRAEAIITNAVGKSGLSFVRRLCVDERALDADADEIIALAGLAALREAGMEIRPDSPDPELLTDDSDDAMTIYEQQIAILTTVYGERE